MRTWTRAIGATKCGSCGRDLVVEDPIQLVILEGVKRQGQRCVWCADGEPPPDLPAAIVNRSVPVPVTHLLRARPGTLPLDYKFAAAGDREPGSDDE